MILVQQQQPNVNPPRQNKCGIRHFSIPSWQFLKILWWEYDVLHDFRLNKYERNWNKIFSQRQFLKIYQMRNQKTSSHSLKPSAQGNFLISWELSQKKPKDKQPFFKTFSPRQFLENYHKGKRKTSRNSLTLFDASEGVKAYFDRCPLVKNMMPWWRRWPFLVQGSVRGKNGCRMKRGSIKSKRFKPTGENGGRH